MVQTETNLEVTTVAETQQSCFAEVVAIHTKKKDGGELSKEFVNLQMKEVLPTKYLEINGKKVPVVNTQTPRVFWGVFPRSLNLKEGMYAEIGGFQTLKSETPFYEGDTPFNGFYWENRAYALRAQRELKEVTGEELAVARATRRADRLAAHAELLKETESLNKAAQTEKTKK